MKTLDDSQALVDGEKMEDAGIDDVDFADEVL